MIIKSTAFKDNSNIPSRYTCDGENINPPLVVTQIPVGTKTLALIVDDPDAPGKTWVHWLMWNIAVEDTRFTLEENSSPKGALFGKNDFDKLEYGGPCPPSGTHRYFFKVYALDRELQIPEGASKEELMSAMKDGLIASAHLIGLYSKRS